MARRPAASLIPRVTLDDGRLAIEPAAGVNLDVLAELGATWSGPRGRWELPGSLWALEATKDLLGDVEADTAALSLPREVRWTGTSSHPHWERLYDYQKDAARRLIGTHDLGYGQLLAMSPGLGKTATSIVAADTVLGHGDMALVVCPASLVPTWYREIGRWSAYPEDWWVMSYERLVKTRDAIAESRWPLLIVDESVMIKSHRAIRTTVLHDAVMAPPKNKRGVPPAFVDVAWLLSGSPIARYPDDLWAQLRMLRPKAFPSYWRFAERYCFVKDNEWGPGKVVVGPRGRYDAKEENRDLIHVVAQEDVLDLPEYIFDVIETPLAGKQATAYRQMLRTFMAELEDGTLEAQYRVDQMIRLQQIVSGIPNGVKHDALLELVRDGIIEGPLLVWTHWKASARALVERLSAHGQVAHVDGDTPDAKRDHLLGLFERAEIDTLVLSLGVGKFGHTFTETRTVAYVDKTFAADDYVQSLKRVRRIGLEHRPVVYTIRAPGTTDDLIERNLEGKLGSISSMTNADLLELLRGLGKEV